MPMPWWEVLSTGNRRTEDEYTTYPHTKTIYPRTAHNLVYLHFFQASSGKCTSVVQCLEQSFSISSGPDTSHRNVKTHLYCWNASPDVDPPEHLGGVSLLLDVEAAHEVDQGAVSAVAAGVGHSAPAKPVLCTLWTVQVYTPHLSTLGLSSLFVVQLKYSFLLQSLYPSLLMPQHSKSCWTRSIMFWKSRSSL